MKKLMLVLLVIAFGCKPSGDSDLKMLKDEIMAIHDEVMPKMGELRRIRKDLMLQADSLVEVNSKRADMLNELAMEMEAAKEGMMQWMRGFQPDFDGTEEEVKAYLEDQKKIIQQVKEDMLIALEKGRSNL